MRQPSSVRVMPSFRSVGCPWSTGMWHNLLFTRTVVHHRAAVENALAPSEEIGRSRPAPFVGSLLHRWCCLYRVLAGGSPGAREFSVAEGVVRNPRCWVWRSRLALGWATVARGV